MVPGIIPLNTKDGDARPPTGAPISGDKSSFVSLLGHLPTESEGGFSLVILITGRPITHILILIFHHCHIFHL